MDKRKKSEKDFHNEIFDNNKREKVNRYYAVQQKSNDAYYNTLISNCNNKKVLEYGCGTGSMAFSIAKNGGHATGIDISDKGIELAKKIADDSNLKIDFYVMDAEALEFSNNSFDLICGTGILHHLNLEKAYSQLSRVVNKNGFIIFDEPLGHNPLLNLYRKLTPSIRTSDEHPLKVRDINLIKKYFKKVDAQYYNLLTPIAILFINTKIFNKMVKILSKIEETVLKLIPFLKRYCWTVVLMASEPIEN